MRFKRVVLQFLSTGTVLTTLGTHPLSAQVTLTGTVVDQERTPLTGVVIATGRAGVFAVSQDSGRFRLDGLTTGTHPLTLRWIGVETQEFRLSIPDGVTGDYDVGEIVFQQDPLRLEDIVVSEQAPSMYSRDLEQFELMRRAGLGYFFTAEDLAAMHVATASQVTYGIGGMPKYDPLEGNTIEFYRRGRRCTAAVTVNGIRSSIHDVDFLAPLDRIGGLAIVGCDIFVWTKPIPPEKMTRFRAALSIAHADRQTTRGGTLIGGALSFPIAGGAAELYPSVVINTASEPNAVRWGFQLVARRHFLERPLPFYIGTGMAFEKRATANQDITPAFVGLAGVGFDIGPVRPFVEIQATAPVQGFPGYLKISGGVAVRNW